MGGPVVRPARRATAAGNDQHDQHDQHGEHGEHDEQGQQDRHEVDDEEGARPVRLTRRWPAPAGRAARARTAPTPAVAGGTASGGAASGGTFPARAVTGRAVPGDAAAGRTDIGRTDIGRTDTERTDIGRTRAARKGPAGAGAALVLALAVAALGGCTAGGGSGGTASDAKSAAVGGSSAPTAPPGKYQTLPQPCTALDLDLLHKLVPGAQDYAGTESLTYDTDRRVGCAWHGTTDQRVSSSLSIDIERVMSYDPAISDEAQAELDWDQRATAASISLVPVTTTGAPTAAAAGAAGTASPPAGGGTATPPGAPAGTAGATGTGGASTGSGSNAADADPSLAPRLLTSVGDRAFINDVLKTPAAGPRRTVTVVFRTANVVASVTYSVAEPRGVQPAQSADLQKSAKQAAQQLERKVER